MKLPYSLISVIHPKKDEKIDSFDRHSKYLIKVLAPVELSKTLFQYSKNFFGVA